MARRNRIRLQPETIKTLMAKAHHNVQVEVKDAYEVKRVMRKMSFEVRTAYHIYVVGGMGLVGATRLFGISPLWVELPALAAFFYRRGVLVPRFKKQLAADDAAHELRTEED